MNPDRFSEKIKYGPAILAKIRIACDKQNLNLDRILYDYYPLFCVAEDKAEMKKILSDIQSYNSRNNLLNIVQKTTHTLRIKKEITPVEIEEGEIWCPKCGGKRVLRTQAQTRSGDEAMTAFFRCANPEKHCLHKWKVN